ncbi:hypothetical protein GH733_012612 [Mirounga leonina]|nr:hypothetical protein GH733_012612 [Mirounga leonina]
MLEKSLMNVINMGRSLAVVQALLSITVHTVERPFIAFILPMKAINVGKPLASINPLIDISPHWRKTLYMHLALHPSFLCRLAELESEPTVLVVLLVLFLDSLLPVQVDSQKKRWANEDPALERRLSEQAEVPRQDFRFLLEAVIFVTLEPGHLM